MGKSLYDHCIENNIPHLLSQWHPVKNGALTPDKVAAGSHEKVWWLCEKGHEWQARINSRKQGRGCPICAGKIIIPGENDLASQFPELAAQWNTEKNGGITPDSVFAGSHEKAWWLCEKGHEWEARINSRKQGRGCPVCAGKIVIPGENDLASRFPELAARWHPDKNGGSTPQNVGAFSNRKAWWLCEKGHEYEARVADIAGGRGCPYCAGRKVLVGFNDLATTIPSLAEEWHRDMNGDLTPEMVTAGSNKKVWWQCREGHVWQACVFSRTGKRRHGCPVCAKKVNQKRRDRYVVAVADYERVGNAQTYFGAG